MVTQHFALVPTLTVAENVVLGDSGALLNPRKMEEDVRELSERFGMPVDPAALVRHLSVGERQRVEILKALSHNARVLILDEPTAVLVPQEVDVLFEALNRLRKDGLSVIFISHKLYEVMTVCDRITVLRDGRLVGTVEKSQTNQTNLARMMVGRENFGVTRQDEHRQAKCCCGWISSARAGVRGLKALDRISLRSRRVKSWGWRGFQATARASCPPCWTACSCPPAGTFG